MPQPGIIMLTHRRKQEWQCGGLLVLPVGLMISFPAASVYKGSKEKGNGAGDGASIVLAEP